MTPKALVSAIEVRLGISGKPIQLRDAIESELLRSGVGVATAAEVVDQVKDKVASEILRRKEARDAMGEIAILHLHGSQNELVHGSSFVFSTDSHSIRQAKINRRSVDEIYRSLKGLNFSQFELFGSRVLNEIGCPTPKVTQHAGDQGIDFYGDLSVGGLLGFDPGVAHLLHQTRVILVGQAKHYPNSNIGPSTVRELVGALSLSRTFTFSSDNIDLLSEVKLRPFSPVLALLFSTGDFTKGARNLAAKAGLIVFSGWQLSVFLADKGIGIVEHNGEKQFDPVKFGEWLS